MNNKPLAVIVLAAGLGTRMKSATPKVLHRIAGRPLLRCVLDAVEALQPERIAVVIGPDMERVAAAAAPHPVAIQERRLGTGHAVLAAQPLLDGFAGDVAIVYGDTPLLSTATLRRLVAARRAPADPAVAALGFRPRDPAGYGRLVTTADGDLEAIVEDKDATAAERAIPLCNSGVLCVDGALLFPLLARVRNDNAKGEYYLTDLVALARAAGRVCAVVEGEETEMMGVNARSDLAEAEAVAQARLRARAMAEGATLIDPATVFFSFDTRLGRDVVVHPFVVFGPNVVVGDDVEIRGFCHFEDAAIAAGAQIGPYARLRPGARIGPAAHIGNFVEVKNAVVADGAKVNHLTYLGDADVGRNANIGAGTITCNYDGFFKSRTVIGEGAFIGSNAALVAPVEIGAGAIVGAGTVVAKNVPADALAVTRGPHVEKAGWAQGFRERKQAEKQAKRRAAEG